MTTLTLDRASNTWSCLKFCSLLMLFFTFCEQGGIYVFVLFDNFSQARTVIVIGFIQLTTIAWVYGKHSLIYRVGPFTSVRVIAHSNLSQVPPLLMHVGKWLAVMLAIKLSAGVAPEVDLGEYTLHSPLQNKAKPTLAVNLRGDITRNPKQR